MSPCAPPRPPRLKMWAFNLAYIAFGVYIWLDSKNVVKNAVHNDNMIGILTTFLQACSPPHWPRPARPSSPRPILSLVCI